MESGIEKFSTKFEQVNKNTWRVFVTNGAGTFSAQVQTFTPPEHAKTVGFFKANYKNFDIEVGK